MQSSRTLTWVFLVLFSLVCSHAFAQSGANDPTFNPADVGPAGPDLEVNATAIQADGKVIVVGYFYYYSGVPRSHVARLNADGTLDTSFDPGTGASDDVYATAIQADGKIIIAGDFIGFNGIYCYHIARLNADGSLDTGFDPGTAANNAIATVAIQADGKILIGGQFTSFSGIACNHIARLNEDGSLDSDFDIGTGANGGVYSIAVQSDGKILVGGYFTTCQGITCNHIARLDPDGGMDADFGIGTGADDHVQLLTLDPDGKILLSGFFNHYDGIVRNGFARLNADGSLDTGFDLGSGPNEIVRSILLQPDGRVIIGGDFTSYDGTPMNHIARLSTDGSLDGDFDIGTGASGSVYALASQTDGQIIIGGEFNYYNGWEYRNIARLHPDGSVDTIFNNGTGPDYWVNRIVFQPDGKILIAGEFGSYDAVGRPAFARLNEDGTLDTGFNPGSGQIYGGDPSSIIVLQPDGKLVVRSVSNNNDVLGRLNTDGSVDPSFDTGTGADDPINSASLQSDGKIIVGGNFDHYNGQQLSGLVRLNADGSLDPDFAQGMMDYGAAIHFTAIQPDGKIIIVGGFSEYGGVSQPGMARLNLDGSLDPSFTGGVSGSGLTSISCVTLEPNGKMLLGGNSIVQLNSDGSLDTGFDLGTGPNNTIRAISLQPNGRIIIAGDFTSYDGTQRIRIARLNADGSLDTTFDPGTGATNPLGSYSTVCAAATEADGKIVIGGKFVKYGGAGRSYIARILMDSIVQSEVTLTGGVSPCAGGTYDIHIQSGFGILPVLDTTVQTGPECSYSLNYYPTTPLGFLRVTTSCDGGLTFISDSAYFSFNSVNTVTVNVNLVCGGGAAPCQALFNIAQALDDDSLPIPNVLSLYNTSNGGSGVYTYSWDFGDGFTSTENTPVHSYTGNGPYWLCLTIDDGLGCTDTYCDSVSVDDNGIFTGVLGGGGTSGFTINVIDQTGLGVTELHSTAGLTIWPNPASDILNLTLVDAFTGVATLTVTDMSGSVVRSLAIGLTKGRNQLAMPIGELSDGLYLLRIGNASGYMSQRFVKMR